jgi:hypothetical protein
MWDVGKRTEQGARGKSFWWWVGLVLGLTSAAAAQSPTGARSYAMLSSGGLTTDGALNTAHGEIVREIDDPHTGDRWLLMRNEQFPGGPGRLVLVAAHRVAYINSPERLASNAEAGESSLVPVIRTGDKLIVEEHTAVVDAVLEARALSPAAVGAGLDVRLAIGGNVMRAVALGPGRAALYPGARP